jgi:acyl carrier protein
MNHPTPEKPILKLRRWVIESSGRADDGGLHPDSNLLEQGYVDSLGLISLILFVENLRGTPISENQMSVQSFISLRQIEKTFFADGAPIATAPDAHHTVPSGSVEHA